MKFLAIYAHPDDVDFSCAGTIAKLSEEGNECYYCLCTDGTRGIEDDLPDTKKVKLRENDTPRPEGRGIRGED